MIFNFFSIKINFLSFLLMYEYSEEDSLLERIKKYVEGNLKKKKKKVGYLSKNRCRKKYRIKNK
jgi:hypothetical protein